MFNSSPIIVGLELGTSKVCAVVGQLSDGGVLNIIGLGQSRSRAIRKGEIVNASDVAEDIRNAIVEAEQMADVEIRSVYLGVTGGHIRGFNNRGFHSVVSADREIAPEDVHDVIKNAKAINLSAENRVVHVVRQHFSVDGQNGIADPVGMFGARLEVDVHVVHGQFTRLQNPIRAVKGVQIDVENIVFTGLASSLALLSNEQKELGALVIDIGGGTTEFIVYSAGTIKHTGVFAIGGDHISNDLGYGLKVPLPMAEKLKIEHGSAAVDDSDKGVAIQLPCETGLPDRTLQVGHLRRIMSLRVEEILELVNEEIEGTGLREYMRAGAFLCGGGARIPQIDKVASRILGMPASIGRTNSMSGLKSALDQPEFSTAIGLVKFGSFEQQKHLHRTGPLHALKSRFSQFFRVG